MKIPNDTILRVERTGRKVLKISTEMKLGGCFVVLIGPNGGGKTALLKAVCGFGPFEVSPPVDPPARFLYLDHDPLVGVESWMPAIDVARLYLRKNERYVRDWLQGDKNMEENLRQAVLRRAPISEISTGQRQALMMLCAAKLHTPLCAFDESFSALDPLQFKRALAMVTTIGENLRKVGGVVMIATHDYEVMQQCVAAGQTAQLPIRYVSVNRGTATEITTVATTLTRDAFNEMYL
jgi:ABC-type Mn2+/Zn2+ transport system ATPase subunit